MLELVTKSAACTAIIERAKLNMPEFSSLLVWHPLTWLLAIMLYPLAWVLSGLHYNGGQGHRLEPLNIFFNAYSIYNWDPQKGIFYISHGHEQEAIELITEPEKLIMVSHCLHIHETKAKKRYSKILKEHKLIPAQTVEGALSLADARHVQEN